LPTPRRKRIRAAAELKRSNVHVSILSGDRAAPVNELARSLGVDDAVHAIAELRARGRTVAMVGDGIHDAPALAAEGVGVAIEAADCALPAADPARVPRSLALGQRTLSIVRGNLP
jgi:P-type E1-E2 ATPase